jgi:leader peptidase (prepilin peptidase)/N-methyltransferase
MLNLFTTNFTLFLIISLLFGLAIGSFLNVVIYRLPLMIQATWRRECCEFLQIKNKEEQTINLMWPRSYCPHCQHKLSNWHNIPLISYLFLKGKCAFCKKAIAWRYPFIELLTGLFTGFIIFNYGITWPALVFLIFTYCFIVLTFIDFDHQLLPDIITLPLLWLGLLININNTFTELSAAIIGAVAGYLSLWLVANLYKLITGRMGMGHGDFKLLALIGAWTGWQILPLVILLASFLGAVIGIGLILFKKQGRHVPIPFGPYLAIAGWLGLLFNNQLATIYSWLI